MSRTGYPVSACLAWDLISNLNTKMHYRTFVMLIPLAGGWHPAPDMLVEHPDVSRQDAFLRVDRLMVGTQTIGSCCRLSDGIILTARHSIIQPDVVSKFVGILKIGGISLASEGRVREVASFLRFRFNLISVRDLPTRPSMSSAHLGPLLPSGIPWRQSTARHSGLPRPPWALLSAGPHNQVNGHTCGAPVLPASH